MPKSITLLVGARACGKSTLANIIKALSRDPRVVAIDSKTAIEYHIKRRTEIGQQLEEYKPVMAAGGLLPSNLTFAAIMTYVRLLESEHRLKLLHLILAGSPRRPEEVELWKDNGVPFKVVYIQSTWEEVLLWANYRQRQGCRADCSPEALKRGWDEYQRHIVPAVRMVSNEHRLVLKRSDDLLSKVQATVNFMNLPNHVKNKWRRRLNAPDHPARKLIEEIPGSLNQTAVLA